jgi:hypothetical protein
MYAFIWMFFPLKPLPQTPTGNNLNRFNELYRKQQRSPIETQNETVAKTQS